MSLKYKSILMLTCLFLFIWSLNSFARGNSSWRYLKCNVHAYTKGRDIKASYAVWTNPGAGHLLIPVNTKVKMKPWKRGFILLTKDGKEIYYDVGTKRTNFTGEQYFTKILTRPRRTNLSKFSKLDRQGIERGEVVEGMTRKAVRIAYGYPSPHATPDITARNWFFWRSKFRKTKITFNSHDVVINVR